MAKKDDIRNHAIGINHFHDLIPTNVNDSKIDLTSAPLETSTSISLSAIRMGAKVEQLPLKLYSSSALGRYRLKDNSDLLIGYEQLYTSVGHYSQVRLKIRSMIDSIRSGCKGSVLFAEEQHLPKICSQRSRGLGCNVVAPFSPDIYIGEPSSEWLAVLDRVLKIYASKSKVVSYESYFTRDFDPSDTSTGMPLPRSKQQAIPTRLLVAGAIVPPPISNVSESGAHKFLDSLDLLGRQVSFEPGVFYGAMLAYRHGPTNKKIRFGHFEGGEWRSTMESSSLYNRTRQVFPASYIINMLLSDVFGFLHEARSGIPGFWHTPALQDAYTKVLIDQGKYCYTIDFSGMDQHMGPGIIKAIMKGLVKFTGNKLFGAHLMAAMMDRMKILVPDWYGSQNSVTAISTLFGFGSGWKPTGDIDSIYAQTTCLALLERQMPGIIDKWERGQFLFADLGDDIMFTMSKELDESKMIADGKELINAELKLQRDLVFLQKIMPINGEVSARVSPLSRIIQQTFYNEDQYTGKPNGIIKLGLSTRCQNIRSHPFHKAFLLDFTDIIFDMPFAGDMDSKQRQLWSSGDFALSTKDLEDIELYMKSNPGWVADQIAGAEYRQSSKLLIDTLLKYFPTLQSDGVLAGQQVRKAIWKELMGPSQPFKKKELLDAIYSNLMV